MSAIISEKFRIYNAEQFLSALGDDVYDSEGNFTEGDPLAERDNMFFFVGRPQEWYAVLEIYNRADAAGGWASVTEGDTVSADTNSFQAVVQEVLDDAVLLKTVSGATNQDTVPNIGSTLTLTSGAGFGSSATTGVYRYGDENEPVDANDNDAEFFSVYDDLIAAKRMTIAFTRGVIRRYNWALTGTDVYDMYKNDYAPATVGASGKLGSGAVTDRGQPLLPPASSLAVSKFYVMNGQYEVFKCLYNGQSPSNPDGIPATLEPRRSNLLSTSVYRDPASDPIAPGLYFENLDASDLGPNNKYQVSAAGGYVWKFMYKLSIDDVLRFLSTDFIPVSLRSEAETDRAQTEDVAAIDGGIQSAIVKFDATTLPAASYFVPVLGDGTGAVIELVSDGANITGLFIANAGTGYTYGNVLIEDGGLYDGSPIGLHSDAALTTAVTPLGVGVTDTAAIEAIISPRGGHGSGANGTDIERELNTKRVMANIRLTYAEGDGDFPVDNDFRRIGILRNPQATSTGVIADGAGLETLSNLKRIDVTGLASDFVVDEQITQVLSTGGTAKGRIVSFESTGAGTGIISYYQTPLEHTDKGVVRAFEGNDGVTPPAAVTGEGLTPTTGNVAANNVAPFTEGLADTEFIQDTGDIMYLENRRLITRAPDQVEDIKLVIEF